MSSLWRFVVIANGPYAGMSAGPINSFETREDAFAWACRAQKHLEWHIVSVEIFRDSQTYIWLAAAEWGGLTIVTPGGLYVLRIASFARPLDALKLGLRTRPQCQPRAIRIVAEAPAEVQAPAEAPSEAPSEEPAEEPAKTQAPVKWNIAYHALEWRPRALEFPKRPILDREVLNAKIEPAGLAGELRKSEASFDNLHAIEEVV